MEDTIANVAKRQQRTYYGKYRGFVVDNNDPEQRGRVVVSVPSVLGEEPTGWALPCSPFGGATNQGLFMVPEVGSQIWVEFEEGNVDHPIWTGVFWQQAGDPPEEAAVTPPTTRVLRTPSGHVLQFDDASGAESIRLHHPTEAELLVDASGTVSLTDAHGSRLVLDADTNEITLSDSNGNKLTMNASGTEVNDSNGNSIQMAAAGITVKGQQIVIDGTQVAVGGQGGEPLIKGTSFLGMFMTHMHTCTAPGSPSSPPIPQGEMSTLTTKTTAQ